jgi:glycolate oxidase FAD binding subunit
METALVHPRGVTDVADAVRNAAAGGLAVYPTGGGTMQHLGGPETRPGVKIDMGGLTRVIEYPARDMTITVEAGITLAALTEILNKEGQRLPVDVPQAEQATLGGAIAANTSGPRRFGLGTFRDYVIGIQVINDEGQTIKAGGRVVKNVAGYDLCKLYAGSLGTLGIITHVTLKLRPVPEERAIVLLQIGAGELPTALDRLHASRTRPICVDVLNAIALRALNRQTPGLLPEAAWIIAVGFEDNRDAVSWQVQQIVQELGELSLGLEARAGPQAAPLFDALVELCAGHDSAFSFKASGLPSQIGDWCEQVAELPERPWIQAHAGNGIIRGHVWGPLTLERARQILNGLLQKAAEASGNVSVTRCPTEWKSELPIWGLPRGDLTLMQAVKRALDPRGLFNPGRYVGGI